jgi:hypothetical protein
MKVKKIEPPDWDLWLNFSYVELWQAVALSLDIDPDSPLLITVKFNGYKDLKPPNEYCQRLRTVMSHFPEGSVNDSCELASFIAWLKTSEWNMPSQLDALKAQPQAKQPEYLRRYERLLELGGGYTKGHKGFRFQKIEELAKLEAEENRARHNKKTIREDLIKAAQEAEDAKQSGNT